MSSSPVCETQIVSDDDDGKSSDWKNRQLQELDLPDDSEIALFENLEVDEIFDLINFDIPNLEMPKANRQGSDEVSVTLGGKRRKTSCKGSKKRVKKYRSCPTHYCSDDGEKLIQESCERRDKGQKKMKVPKKESLSSVPEKFFLDIWMIIILQMAQVFIFSHSADL